MQKKKLNILLIIVVLGLWGTVIYKSLGNYFTSNTAINSTNKRQTNFNIKNIKKDTFPLEQLKRDPFLDHNTVTPASKEIALIETQSIPKPVRITTPPIKKEVPQPVIFNWPNINYYGYIKSWNKDNQLILIKIDGKLFKVRKNETVNEILISNTFKDSVEVVYQKRKKIFHRN